MVSLKQVKRLFTHEATFSGERQTGTQSDGLGGTQPVYEDVSLTVEGRFESDGAMLARRFGGETVFEGALFVCFGDALAEWETKPTGYNEDTDDPWVIREEDDMTFADKEGEYEVRKITPLYLDGTTPDFVLVEPQEVG